MAPQTVTAGGPGIHVASFIITSPFHQAFKIIFKAFENSFLIVINLEVNLYDVFHVFYYTILLKCDKCHTLDCSRILWL